MFDFLVVVACRICVRKLCAGSWHIKAPWSLLTPSNLGINFSIPRTVWISFLSPKHLPYLGWPGCVFLSAGATTVMKLRRERSTSSLKRYRLWSLGPLQAPKVTTEWDIVFLSSKTTQLWNTDVHTVWKVNVIYTSVISQSSFWNSVSFLSVCGLCCTGQSSARAKCWNGEENVWTENTNSGNNSFIACVCLG